MENIKEIIIRLIGSNEFTKTSSEEIVRNACRNLYELENGNIRTNEIFPRLPTIIKDIVLIIDFDSDLRCFGILGFLEITRLSLEDAINALGRINAVEDYMILKRIKETMLRYGVESHQLRDTANSAELYDITSFRKSQKNIYYNMAEEIRTEAERLYLFQEGKNIFDNLIQYVELYKNFLFDLFEIKV